MSKEYPLRGRTREAATSILHTSQQTNTPVQGQAEKKGGTEDEGDWEHRAGATQSGRNRVQGFDSWGSNHRGRGRGVPSRCTRPSP